VLYWYKSTNADAKAALTASAANATLEAARASVYLLYWYKSANADTSTGAANATLEAVGLEDNEGIKIMSSTVASGLDMSLSGSHVCSRMLTYAHVCSRMLTYAHVIMSSTVYMHVHIYICTYIYMYV
jgi:hypothetical protein